MKFAQHHFSLFLFACTAAVVSAQPVSYAFSTGETTDQGNTVKADFTFTFSGSWLTVDVMNSSSGDGVAESDLVAFLISKPMDGGQSESPVGFSGFTDGWSAFGVEGSTTNNGDDPTKNLGNLLKDYPNVHFFGGYANHAGSTDGKGTGLKEGTSNSFSFDFGNSFGGNDLHDLFYDDNGIHLTVARWQSVGESGNDSAKALFEIDFSDFPSNDPPLSSVPEPRLIAPLAVLGLGGWIFARRRYKAKAGAKKAL